MIINVMWETFQQKYLMKNQIFVVETERSWDFYTYDEIFTIKCIVEKQENQEENVMFVERYLNGNNIIKALSVGEPVEDDEEDDDEIESIESIELKEEEHDDM